MTAFEHVTALFSFVYALALTHLLARIGELIVARERVRFSGLLALAMTNAGILVFANWLSLWDLRSIKTWDIVTITIQFLFAIVVFLICVHCARSSTCICLQRPRSHEREPVFLLGVYKVAIAYGLVAWLLIQVANQVFPVLKHFAKVG